MSLIEKIKESEGFNGMAYEDTEGYLTIGYGTKLPLSEDEAELLLNYRLDGFKKELHVKLPHLDIPPEAWEVVYEMAYQLGVPGFLKFKNMITALVGNNYKLAADEGMDSLWAKQTPNRAKKLMDRLRSL